MPLLRQDSLEHHTVGQAPLSPWTTRVAAGGGAVTIEQDPQAGGTRGKVVRIYDNDVADYSEARFPLFAPKSAIAAVLELYLSQATKNVYVGIVASGVRHDIVSFRTDATIKYRAAGGTWTNLSTVTAYSALRWYKVRLVLDRAASSGELVMVTVDDLDKLTAAVDLDAIAADIEAVYVATEGAVDNIEVFLTDVQLLDKAATISGVMKDNTGARIDGKVHLIRLRANTVAATTTANAQGDYSFSVDAGAYYAVGGYDHNDSDPGGDGRAWIWAGVG